MILKGKERGNGKQLARYLLTMGDNEHVELHELRGFAADNLRAALQEIDAISRGTRCKNTMFSLSLNPPSQARVTAEGFEAAIGAVEAKLGLENYPRAIVFHEKDGRRHAHAVWSRIDSTTMKAINLSLYKEKLMGVSRSLFREHGWTLPKGLIDKRQRDPKTYTLAEYQQAKRAKADPKAIKRLFQECWAASDNGKAFAQALQSRGYTLARGDRRGVVALDFRGEVFAVAKWAGVRAKDVRARIGDGAQLPSLEQVQAKTAEQITETLRRHIVAVERKHDKRADALNRHRAQVAERQRAERAALDKAQRTRWQHEAATRSERLNTGLRGLWDRVTGAYRRSVRQNEREALDALRRDRAEKDRMIERHLDERREVHQTLKSLKGERERAIAELHAEIAAYTTPRSREGVSNSSLERMRAKDFGRTERSR